MSDLKIEAQSSVNNTEGNIAKSQALVMGRLISLFVHETNNHLATLRESSGLGDDIISAAKLSDKEKLKELEKLLGAMDDRIGHAASLVRAFGELGRHMEHQSGSIDINKAIEGILPFLSKVARQKNLKLRTALSQKLPEVAGDLFCFQCLLIALFENFCSAQQSAATATITTEKNISHFMVQLSSDSATACRAEKHPWPPETLKTLADAGGFGIAQHQSGGVVTITLKNQE